MSDSESSSDVEDLFRIAQRNAKAKLDATVNLADSDGMSSDSEEHQMHLLRNRRKNDPGSALKAIESKLKKRKETQLKGIDDCDSDSSGELPQQAAMAPANVVELDLTFSSDDDEAVKSMVQNRGPKRNLDKKTQTVVERLRRARRELESAQSYHGQMFHSEQSPTLEPRSTTIAVKLSCRVQKLLSKEFIHKTLHLSINADDTVEVLKQVLLTELKLKAKTCTVAMSHQGHALSWNRQVSEYELANGSEIHVDVMLSGVSDLSLVGNGRLPANKGKMIKLVLRCKDQQHNVQIGCLEKFEVLVEQYKSLKDLGARDTIILKFDGEKLALNSTPSSCDMEDDDLIDVEVR